MQRNAAVFLALATAMAATLYFGGPARLYAALQAGGATVQGVIVDVECRKSAQIRYRFPAQGHSYTGTVSSIEPCSQFKLGAPMPVVYLPTDPTQNFSGDPGQAYAGYVLVTALASLLMPAFATVAFIIWSRKRAS